MALHLAARDAAADPVACFQDDDGAALEFLGGGEVRQSSSHDYAFMGCSLTRHAWTGGRVRAA